ncbi:MAG: SUMF1/EgtB/PvdO family nonheme iron enzyme [Xenococcus sp. (in: cyanobacteria)]
MANWAICIGINQYDDLQPLKYAVRDAERMKDWLINQAGFPESQVYYFSDNAPSITDASVTFEAKPTYATLIRFLDRRFNKPFLKSGDNLWFFFSGHGSRYQERDYLMFSDSSSNSSLIQQTAISTNFIVERLRKCGADNVMLFVDACREGNKSGRGIELEKEQGVITIASCSPNEFSYEIDALEHGSFTYALLESLDFQGENNCATIERLNRRLRDRVREINNYYKKGRQTPRTVIEPASKYHLILLPDYIRPTAHDIAVLKIDAYKAERQGNLVLAEALWKRLIKFDQEEALACLREIWAKPQRQRTVREADSETVPDNSGGKSVNKEAAVILQQQEPESKQEVTKSVSESVVTPSLQVFEFEVVKVNGEGEEVKGEKSQAKYFTEDLSNGITLDMVSIPGGSFMMGSPEGEGDDSEKPQHKVTVQPFFMGKFQVTQAQWKAIASLPKVERDLETDPSYFKGDDLPVEQVSWYDAVEFCARLSKQTGTEYRLPSEAEWEYACRAGTTTSFHFGEAITGELANYNASYTYANELEGEYRQRTTSVGSFLPNAFGLYDMHGNVWEWCSDDWHDNYVGAPTDGSAWLNGDNDLSRLRGGSWLDRPDICRSAFRNYYVRRFYRNDTSFGFRIVCG